MSLLYDPCREPEGIEGFVYCAHRPFHPRRFSRLLGAEWPGISRIKGFVWIASCMDTVGMWTWADGICTVSPAGRWWAARPERDWPASLTVRAEIRRGWHAAYGDRRQEVVFIGAEMSRDRITRNLDALLLTEEEMAQGEATGWACFADEPEPTEPRRCDP